MEKSIEGPALLPFIRNIDGESVVELGGTLKAPAKLTPCCAKRLPDPGKSASRNLSCATAKAFA
jgi:hypothetical protein